MVNVVEEQRTIFAMKPFSMEMVKRKVRMRRKRVAIVTRRQDLFVFVQVNFQIFQAQFL